MSKQQLKDQLFEEFEYKQKAGTAWSHNFLNQKPWHPLSYPNQRRKWIAEQMHGISDKRKAEVEKEVGVGRVQKERFLAAFAVALAVSRSADA